MPVKRCNSFEFKYSFIRKCQCIRRDGLQDRCQRENCQGYPECMTKLYPICQPGILALEKLTDTSECQ